MQNSEKDDRETFNLQFVNLLRLDILPVYIKERLTLYKVLMFLHFATTQPRKCDDRLINGMFHSRCLDLQANKKIII